MFGGRYDHFYLFLRVSLALTEARLSYYSSHVTSVRLHEMNEG